MAIHAMRLLTRAAKVLFHDATELQYQVLLINMISHVATAVDHKVATYSQPSNKIINILD